MYREIPPLEEKYIERFWSLVTKTDDPEACWIWIGLIDDRGYGRLWISTGIGEGCTYRAHRVAYKVWHGPNFDQSKHVCHHCDNPQCVNPAHLFLGTDLDNQRDAKSKGRHSTQVSDAMRRRGIDHYLRKLDDDAVRRIRTAKGKQRDIAKQFGTTQAQVWRIKNGKAWAHVL